MTITIEHIGGVGINGRYRVCRDGKPVAGIRRDGRGMAIVSAHYGETLGTYRTVEAARTAAATLDYPDAMAVYEQVCQRIEQERRRWYERQITVKIMEAVRDLANGSNSAQHRLIEMVAETEAFAKDRTQTHEVIFQRAAANNTFISGEPYYPEPPKGR